MILFYDNDLTMIRPRGGLWTWFVLLYGYDEAFGIYGDGYVVLRAPMDGLCWRPYMRR